MDNKMNPVVHFEMPYEDQDRVEKFYTEAFGWNMQKLGKDMGDYVTAATTETDKNRMIKRYFFIIVPSRYNQKFLTQFPLPRYWYWYGCS